MKAINRILACFMALAMIGTIALGQHTEMENVRAAEGDTHTIWVIGDSTVCQFADDYYYPRYGWGTQLQNYIDSGSYVVRNIALSGRSSKSYVNDAEYTTLIEGMSEGDYLFIGFGHNDEKTEAERYTNPNGTYTDEGSFANSLYENYIVPAQSKSCNVVLCTPIVRRTTTGTWSNENLHITSSTSAFEGGDYAQAIRDLGTALSIPVVDMTNLTKELYDSLGASETVNLHAWTSSNPSSVDNTHTNIWGAKYNAYFIAKAVSEMNIAGLSDAVIQSTIVSAPTKAENLVVNPDYTEIDYDNNLADSTLWSDYGVFEGTVFGNVGGADKITTDNFNLGADEAGNMHISVSNNVGKIASAVDGMAMYYYKVPTSSTFTLSATVTVNSFTSNNQVSFGLMARDDMYIDSSISESIGDFVAAGPLKLASDSVWNCFARKSGVLTQGGTCVNTYEAGQSIDLKIASNSDGYACTFGDEQTITGGFDFMLTSIDSDYVYVGMYAARNADVTFSNIVLTVDGVNIDVYAEDPSNAGQETTAASQETTANASQETEAGAQEETTIAASEEAGATAAETTTSQETTTAKAQTNSATSSKTGDHAPIGILVTAIIAAAGVIAVALIKKKK